MPTDWRRKGKLTMGAMALVLASAWMAGSASAKISVTTQAELLDRIQIEDLLYAYYGGLEGDEPEDFAAYYTDDAILDVNGRVTEGHDAIQAFYDNYNAMSPGEQMAGTLHVMLNNPRIDIDGDKAVVRMIWTEVNSDSLKLAPRIVEQGTEYTELRKVDGQWLISKRVITNSGGLPDAYDETYKKREHGDH